jgi:hypothetical protein
MEDVQINPDSILLTTTFAVIDGKTSAYFGKNFIKSMGTDGSVTLSLSRLHTKNTIACLQHCLELMEKEDAR